MMFDTGSDVLLLSQTEARRLGLTALKPIRYMDITGVGGGARSPVVRASIKIEDAAPYTTEVVLSNSNFNLLPRREVTKVFNILITATGVSFNPKAGGRALVKRGAAAVEGEGEMAPPAPAPAAGGGGGGFPIDLNNIPPVVYVAGGLIIFAMVIHK